MGATKPHRAASLASTIALVLAVHAVAAGPSDQAAAHYKQGKTFLDAKQYDQAIVEFQAAYAIDKLSSHLFNIADAYDAKHDYDHAIEYYQKYLDAEPKSPRAADVRSRISVATQARADAKRKADEDAARIAAENNRVAAVVHLKQAAAYEQAGAWDKAGDEHRLAFTVDGDPSHLLAAAGAYRKHGDLARTRDAYAAYLDKVPLGELSDATRIKLADVTREIEKADEAARIKKAEEDAKNATPIKQPPKPRSVQVAAIASNATTAAASGNCSVARTLAGQVRDQDPDYYEAVVVPSLGTCADTTPKGPRRVGGGIELRFGTLQSSDFVEGGSVSAKSTLGGAPKPTGMFSLGGFVDIRATPKVRVRAGLRGHTGTAKFDSASCSPTASICPTELHLGLFVGPAVDSEPALYRDGGVDVHLLLGGAIGFPVGKGGLDITNGMGNTMTGPDVTLKTQIEFDLGIGFRSGRLFANLVFMGSPVALTDDIDIGRAKTLAISIGLTTLR